MLTSDVPKQQFTFSRAYEQDHLPGLNPDAHQLFIYAEWLQEKNLLIKNRAVSKKVERLYRIASAWGHYRASHNLSLFLMRGFSDADDIETLPFALATELVKRGIPQGYYDMSVLYIRSHGVEFDPRLSLEYCHKAAELGHPEAQYQLGNRLTVLTAASPIAFKMGLEMKQCAAEQGHATAAYELANYLQQEGCFADALKYYQLAIKGGGEKSAYTLHQAFLALSGKVDYLALEKDEERSRRYEILFHSLMEYSYLAPLVTVDEIDEIVPLPPAELPPWDGTIRWVKAWEANIFPPLPNEARIAEMARAKNLNPADGKPLKQVA